MYLCSLTMWCKKRILSYISIGALLATASCQRYAVPQQQPLYEVTYSGELLLGEPITFQSTAPSNSTFLWLLGDGNESLQQAPTHTFYTLAHNGTEILDDTVTLIINNNIYRPNIKTFRLKPNVEKLKGTHVWKGGYFSLHGNCCAGMADHSLNDTLFGITVTDEYTVKTWGLNLPYLSDSNYYSNDRRASLYNSTRLRYTKDTIYFMQRIGTDTGYAEIRYYHKY